MQYSNPQHHRRANESLSHASLVLRSILASESKPCAAQNRADDFSHCYDATLATERMYITRSLWHKFCLQFNKRQLDQHPQHPHHPKLIIIHQLSTQANKMQYILLIAAFAALSNAAALPQALGNPTQLESTYTTTSKDLQTLSENISITGKSDRSSASWKIARAALTNFAIAANDSAPHTCPFRNIVEATTPQQANSYVDQVQRAVTGAYDQTTAGESNVAEFCLADSYMTAVNSYLGATA